MEKALTILVTHTVNMVFATRLAPLKQQAKL
jgi:hypothetical protein